MKLVILESPYAGDVEVNTTYARRALADSLRRGEAPLASHLLYTQPGVLDDTVPAERARGIEAGLAWGEVADATALYLDRGLSRGMVEGIVAAVHSFRPIECRFLDIVDPAVAGKLRREVDQLAAAAQSTRRSPRPTKIVDARYVVG